jgi:Flp pilus assembly protein CpaB
MHGSSAGQTRLDLRGVQRQLSDTVSTHRRLIAAVLAGIAIISGLTALRPKPAATIPVWAAARDLTGGTRLVRSDLVLERLPPGDVPLGALAVPAAPTGRLLAAPVRRGEPLTDVRLLSAALLTGIGAASDVAVPVRVTDGPAALALVQTGDSVDVISTDDGEAVGVRTAASVVVEDVRVLAVPDHVTADGAGLVIVAATAAEATALAMIPAGNRISLALRPTP